MNKVGKFEKVSFERFLNDIRTEFGDKWNDNEIREFYDKLKLPKRATKDSAGYDFYSPFPFSLTEWDDIKIPTGIRARLSGGWFLMFASRSGLGSRHYLRPANLPPIIDGDYYGSSNEGHIHIKVRTETHDSRFTIKQGDAFVQAIFVPYGVTEDDDGAGIRDGGFGSTDG